MLHSPSSKQKPLAFLRFLRSGHFGVHLILLVLLKIAILVALWYVLIKPYRVNIKIDEMAQQLTVPTQEK